jgi:hypothetical protein
LMYYILCRLRSTCCPVLLPSLSILGRSSFTDTLNINVSILYMYMFVCMYIVYICGYRFLKFPWHAMVFIKRVVAV